MADTARKREGLGALTLVALVVLTILALMGLIWGLLQSGKPVKHNPANAGGVVIVSVPLSRSMPSVWPTPF